MPKARLHILVGENETENGFEDAAKCGGYVRWAVPKSAAPGDPAFFVFHWNQLCGAGTVESHPRNIMFGRKPSYQARIGHIRLFRRPLPLAELQSHLPEWKWPTLPKHLTTPDEDVAREVNRIVGGHVMRSGFRYAPSANLPQRREKKGRSLGSVIRSRKPTNLELDASFQLQTAGVTLGAEGRRFLRAHLLTERDPGNREKILELRARQRLIRCDACDVDLGERYGPEHREVLELHHKVPLSRGPRTPSGTEAFALLCPTCHRVVHHGREDPLAVADLQRLLASRNAPAESSPAVTSGRKRASRSPGAKRTRRDGDGRPRGRKPRP